jgi:hypothetical protein
MIEGKDLSGGRTGASKLKLKGNFFFFVIRLSIVPALI